MNVMNKMVTEFMDNHQLIEENAVVLVGVSGGPDSIALLHFYLSIKEQWNLTIIAVSVDHQLRGEESKADLHFVQEMCREWDIEFIGAALDVKTYERKHQVSTQLASREMRYQFFEKQMETYQADYLALGHHGDDQVETMLMGFVRSSSPVALSGIPFRRKFASGYIVRPFLCVTKDELINYCKMNDITPRNDPSNDDVDYTRNYFRKKIIPIINEQNSNIHKTVQRLSENLQMDEQFLQEEANKSFHKVVTLNKEKREAAFKIIKFQSYPKALQRRIYHLILDYLYENLPMSLSYVHEEYFFSLLKVDKGNVQIDFPDHLKIERSYETILFHFQTKATPQPSFQETLTIPGQIRLPDGSELIARYTAAPQQEDRYTYYLTPEVALPLHVRTRVPGDRMSWQGLDGSKKIKDIFIDEKIQRSKRDEWPIVVDNNGTPIWLIGLRKGKVHNNNHSSYMQLIYRQGNV